MFNIRIIGKRKALGLECREAEIKIETLFIHIRNVQLITFDSKKILLCPILSYIRKSVALFKGSHALSTCPSDKSSVRYDTRMCKERWWNDNDWGNRSTRRKRNSLTLFPDVTWAGLVLIAGLRDSVCTAQRTQVCFH
jgi:hypothetical protein